MEATAQLDMQLGEVKRQKMKDLLKPVLMLMDEAQKLPGDKVSEALTKCRMMLMNMEPERFLSKASRSQCEAMGAWESGRYKTFFFTGSNQCVSKETLIDTPQGKREIGMIGEDFEVWSFNEFSRKVVKAQAKRPFIKGREEMWRIEFGNGGWIEATKEHRILLTGGWTSVGSLLEFCEFHLPSISGTCLSKLQQGVRCSVKTIQDSQCGCLACHCSCGGQLHEGQGNDQVLSPSQADVQVHSMEQMENAYGHEDVQCNTQVGIHPCQLLRHLSNQDDLLQSEGQSVDIQCRASCTPLKSVVNQKFQLCQQSICASCHLQSIGESSLRGIEFVSASETFLKEGMNEGHTSIVSIKFVGVKDVWDTTVPGFDNYFAGGVVQHNSGKTAVSARIVGEYLRDKAKPGDIYWFIAPNSEKSVGTQQRLMADILPKWLLGDCVWTEKNGFGSKNPMLVLHKRDPKTKKKLKPIVVKFKSESQYDEDPSSFESETLNGVWVDEAVEQRVYSALLPRLVVKNGWMLISTIPSAGWMWETLANAPDGTGVKMVKMWAGDNPAITPEALERLKASITDPDEYEMRINGNFKMLSGIVFREFTKEHIVKDEQIPTDLTYWGGLDSGFDHPTVFLLLGVSRDGRIFVIEEYSARLRTVKENAQEIKRLIGRLKLAGPIYIDPSCASITAANRVSVLRQYSLAGLEVTKARRTQDIGEKIIVDGIRQLFRDHSLFVSERCKCLIRELKVWSYKRDNHGASTSRETYVDKNNDAIDALKYVAGSGIRYIDPRKPRCKPIFI